MLNHLKSWLDAREDARRRGRHSQEASTAGGGAAAADAAAAASHPSSTTTATRRAGLRPRAPAKAPAGAENDAYVLVTVGTTKFEALIKAVDTPEFAQALEDCGYTRLVVQKGAGTYAPARLVEDDAAPSASAAPWRGRLRVETFDFAPSLAALLSAAALVVSHAGSGSVFEALSLGRPLVVVPNPILMDNHQAELAEHLEREGVAARAEPEAASLAAAVRAVGGGGGGGGSGKPQPLRPYVPGDPSGIVRRLDWLTGRSQEEEEEEAGGKGRRRR